MKRTLLTYLILTVAVWSGFAQRMSVSAPSKVSAGENFRISYTINTQDVESFHLNLRSNDVVEVIAGPYTSSQSSFQMMNGHTSSSSSITYTYTLYAAKHGTVSIPAAVAKVGGKTISSQPVRIVVSGSAQNNGNTAPQMHDDDGDEPEIQQAGSQITGKDLFIKVSANKRHVHEQEPIVLTYKVYTLVGLTQLDAKMPDLTGFHIQEVKLPAQKSFHVETVNGRAYRCVTWSQYVMFPQMTGNLQIPSITFKGIVVQQNRSVDPFEAFFNGGSGYIEVKRNIVAPGLSVMVDPLPTRPANFSGGVGKFNISAQLNKKEVKAGDPINLRIVVNGTGNLKLIKQPVLTVPKDFDQYDAKITDKTQLTGNGVEGNMIYDILLVPRNQGNYTLPPITFTYYDTALNKYKTVQTKAFSINVLAGKGSNSNVTDFSDDQPKDIRPLMMGDTDARKYGDTFFGSVAFWLWLVVPLASFVALLIIFRKRAIENADIVRVKGKRANKVATKRLRLAQKLMLEGRQDAFYDEVLRALWGYVGDKMNISVEQLSRENITETLENHGIEHEVIDKFVVALEECEFERFAPGDPSGNMNKTFDFAMSAITEIENFMKKRSKKQTPPVSSVLLVAILLCLPLQLQATTKANADTEYRKGNYQQAIKDYQELLSEGVSAELYYNLGNAYFRSENIPQAILAYERALKLAPGNSDVRFNLQFARSKSIDKINPESEMFFITWYNAMVNSMGVDSWAKLGIIAVILALCLCLVYLFVSSMTLKKIGFFGMLVCVVVFLAAMWFAVEQKGRLHQHDEAIILKPAIMVKKSPTSSEREAFMLHEGTKITITDRSLKNWYEIRVADGRTGWIDSKSVEEI